MHMKIDIVSIFPQIFENIFDYGIIKQALKIGLVDIECHDLRTFSNYNYKQVDDRPFGGGAGMVLMIEPLANAVNKIKSSILLKQKLDKSNNRMLESIGVKFLTYEGIVNENVNIKQKVIYLSPKGKKLTQELAEELSKEEHLILICGRYEGVDQRFIDNYVDEEISIGDYVLSGGEFPAMVLIDVVVRLIPGAIKNKEFNDSESFSDPTDRTKLDFPQYTRPEDFNGLKVPEVLLSGDHKKIEGYRKKLVEFNS